MSATNSRRRRSASVSLVVGLGTMGIATRAPIRRSTASNSWACAPVTPRRAAISTRTFPGVPRFEDLTEALAALKPDAVSICAYTEHHAPMALEALAAGAHVFCEKPLAESLEAAEKVVAAARKAKRRCWSATSCASIPHGRASSRSAARSASRSSCA